MTAPALFALLGLLGGLAYFAALRRSLAGAWQWRRVAGGAVLRLIAAGLALWLAAQAGAAALLAVLAGFLAGRWLILRKGGP
jgi:hypothetical protein